MLHRLARHGLRLLCAVVAGFASPVLASPVAPLTADEQAYVASHPEIPYCVDPDWEPFEIITRDGTHEGIAADLLRLAAQRVGLTLRLVRTKDWDESLSASQEGRCTMLSFLNQTNKREQWLTFTDPLFIDSNVFITRQEHAFILDPSSLEDETIVFPSGTAMEERIRQDYPNLRTTSVESERDAIHAVEIKKADLTLRSLIVAAYVIRKEGLFNLKIAGQLPSYANHLRVGIRKSEPLLRDILNKGIASITPFERGQIVNRHVSIKVEAAPDYTLLLWGAGGLSVVLFLVSLYALHQRSLRCHLQRVSRTDALTNLANRTWLNSVLPAEISRALRSKQALSVILLDIDHFKKINDQYGHLIGDQVLIKVAKLLQAAVRPYDTCARWGGEEFLILCPNTSLSVAHTIAERVRLSIAEHDFGAPGPVTISAGVSCLIEYDSEDKLLGRADSALYISKNQGRNRVTIG